MKPLNSASSDIRNQRLSLTGERAFQGHIFSSLLKVGCPSQICFLTRLCSRKLYIGFELLISMVQGIMPAAFASFRVHCAIAARLSLIIW